MASSETKFCEECRKVMRIDEFYKTYNLEKYPDGYLNKCKKCITKRVDNWDPQTFLWILQEADVPYIPEQWESLLASYGKDKSKVTGMTIIGRYLGKMRMNQFKDYRWADNERLQELANFKKQEAMKQAGYDAADIAFELEKDSAKMPTGEVAPPIYTEPTPAADHMYDGEDYFASQVEDIDLSVDLTDEDRRYLLIKWGKTYKPEEWVKLEQFYNDMTESYDIQGAGHEDTLKLICKTSLKANQLLDMGDVDGAQKMTKMYNDLMKSGKFTAAQNKAENGEFLDSISEFVLLCEKEGFIARFYTDKPNDRVDETIKDLQGYTHDLVYEEMNLGNLIENAVKEMAKEEAKEEDEDIEDELNIEELEELKDEDFTEFNDFVEDEEEADEELLRQLVGEDE